MFAQCSRLLLGRIAQLVIPVDVGLTAAQHLGYVSYCSLSIFVQNA